MLQENSPLVFWDYCAERRAAITNMTTKKLFQLKEQTPHFTKFGEEGDISKICQFGWYEWVYFWETTEKAPFPAHVLGICLGPANNEGNKMTQWVLNQNGQIVPRRTMQRLTPEEWARKIEIKKRSEFNDSINAR